MRREQISLIPEIIQFGNVTSTWDDSVFNSHDEAALSTSFAPNFGIFSKHLIFLISRVSPKCRATFQICLCTFRINFWSCYLALNLSFRHCPNFHKMEWKALDISAHTHSNEMLALHFEENTLHIKWTLSLYQKLFTTSYYFSLKIHKFLFEVMSPSLNGCLQSYEYLQLHGWCQRDQKLFQSLLCEAARETLWNLLENTSSCCR